MAPECGDIALQVEAQKAAAWPSTSYGAAKGSSTLAAATGSDVLRKRDRGGGGGGGGRPVIPDH